MAFTFPENLEQRCNAAGFIWRKDDDREEKRDRAITFVLCGRIWRLVEDLAQTLPSKSSSSLLACSNASANCMDLMWNDGTEMTHCAKWGIQVPRLLNPVDQVALLEEAASGDL